MGLVILIDGIEQLSSQNISWLPSLPENIAIILSTSSPEVIEISVEKNWPTMKLEPLENIEKKALVLEYMKYFRKTLKQEHIKSLVQSSQCSSPLFLRILLDEIRVFGVFEKLDSVISYYLTAQDIPQVFHK